MNVASTGLASQASINADCLMERRLSKPDTDSLVRKEFSRVVNERAICSEYNSRAPTDIIGKNYDANSSTTGCSKHLSSVERQGALNDSTSRPLVKLIGHSSDIPSHKRCKSQTIPKGVSHKNLSRVRQSNASKLISESSLDHMSASFI